MTDEIPADVGIRCPDCRHKVRVISINTDNRTMTMQCNCHKTTTESEVKELPEVWYES